ncbi:hypothetical protein WJ542_21345 [Paraburkholderia sp. B3]|uniref:hypothetical protein n=1 Tax=Paraburkholderia sp. B3 TaxID=3134791 RepID=UPI003981ABC6
MSLRIYVSSQMVARTLAGIACPRNPFIAIFMLMALFGSWEATEAAIKAYKATDIDLEKSPDGRPKPAWRHERNSKAQRLRIAKSIPLLPEASLRYNEIRKANPHFSHTDVVCALPIMYRVAATRARLAKHGAELVPARRGREYRRSVDKSLLSHIKRRSREFVKRNVPFRITRSRLLSGFPKLINKENLSFYPKTAAALEKCVETSEQRYLRLIKAAMRSGKLEGLTASSEHIVDEMDLHRLKLVWAQLEREDAPASPVPPHRAQPFGGRRPRSTPASFSLSPIYPGEPLAGYLGRNCWIGKTSFCKAVTGSYRLPSWIIPTRIDEHVRRLGECVGPVDEVLDKNTLLPGYSRFLSADAAHALRQRHLAGPPLQAPPYFTNRERGAYGPSWTPAICLACLREDLDQTGIPFWRREFLFTPIRVCARHETPLYEFCEACTQSLRNSATYAGPQKRCTCGSPLQMRPHDTSIISQEIEIDMAQAWAAMLEPTFAPHMHGPQLAELLRRGLIENGLTKGDGRVDPGKFRSLISSPEQRDIGMRLGMFSTSPLISRALSGLECPRSPFATIFMLITLYGSWKAVKTEITSYKASETSREAVVPARATAQLRPTHKIENRTAVRHARSVALLPETAVLYNAAQAENPHLAHREVVLLLPAMHQLAATRDNLRAHGANLAPARIGAEHRDRIAESLPETIERRWKELIDMDVPFRICAYRLLGETPARCHRDLLAKFPGAAAVLEKFTETFEAFHRRVVKSAIRLGKLKEFAPDDEGLVDEMAISDVKRLWTRVRKSHGNP